MSLNLHGFRYGAVANIYVNVLLTLNITVLSR